MSDFYKKLNLPLNPIKPEFDFMPYLLKPLSHQFCIPVEEAMTIEILDAFNAIGFKPDSVTVFASSKRRELAESLLHSDILQDSVGQWKPISYGINWEVRDADVTFSWWTTKRKEQYPIDPRFFVFKPQGIHYGDQRLQRGVSENDVFLDSVETNNVALLVRTDVPHTTVWPHDLTRPQPNVRIAVSIRFDDGMHISWNEAVEKFKPLIIS
jgi:hypothetical protein